MQSKKHLFFSLAGLTLLVISVVQFSACSSSSSSGVAIGPNDPFAGLAVSQTIQTPQGSLQYPVEVIRDTWGIPHIYGRTMTDVAFAQGYAEASDRLFEMDMFRHIADGTLTEYFGPQALNEDIHSRLMGFPAIAKIVYDQTPPDLQGILQSFCNGVNFYLSQLAAEVQANPSAKVLPAEYSSALMSITITDIKPFTPEDIIAFGKFESYSLTMEDEGTKIHATHYFNAAATTFTSTSTDPGLAHFSGLTYDFARSEPAEKAPGVPVPNPFSYATSTTFSLLSLNTAVMVPQAQTMNTAPAQPLQLNQQAIQGALDFYKSLQNGPFGFLYKPREAGEIGSNNWVISPGLTKDGYAILANDTHLPLYNPPIWYEIHLNTAAIGKGNINTIGVVFPGAPGVVIGHNDYIAWGDTVFPSDVIDVYQDQVVNCGGQDCVVYNGQDVPVQTVPMVFHYGGALGRGLAATTVTIDTYYVTIPGHGSMPVYPGSYTPGVSTALEAFTWTGMVPSNELEAFYKIDQAQNLAQFITAQSYFKVGSQNFVYADIYGNIYLTDQSTIPLRGPDTFSYTTNVLPSGLPFSDFTYPPYLMLPGTDPNVYWAGTVPTSAVPYVENPTQGYIATANEDPVGVTYNNEPQNNPYYLGGFYDPGYRAWEIDRDIEADKGNIDLAYVQNVIQADHTDTYALQILPFLQQAYTDMANTITVTSDPQIAQAMNYLNEWSSSSNTHPYDTPTGLSPSATTQDINNSIATSLFEGFVQRLFYNIFYDKMQAIGQNRSINDMIIINTLVTLLQHPTQCATYSPLEGHSTLLDALVPTTSGYTFSERSLDNVMIQSLAEGINDLSQPSNSTGTPTSFGTSDMSQWEWGKLHTLTFSDLISLTGDNQFNLADPANNNEGYPRPGSMFSVDPGTFGFEMGNLSSTQTKFYTNYTYNSGPAIRFSVEMKPNAIVGYNVLPGGESGEGPDPANPPKHYGDQIPLWVNNQVHPQWFYPKDIIQHTESRTIFEP